MKKLVLVLLSALAFASAHGQCADPAMGPPPYGLYLKSQLHGSVTGSVQLQLVIKGNALMPAPDTLYFSDDKNLFSYSPAYVVAGNLEAGDSLVINIAANYSVSSLPYYALPVTLRKQVMPNVLSNPMATGFVYFTPYNTIEVWSERDFNSLNRVWLNDNRTSVHRKYIHPDSIPQASVFPTQGVPEYQRGLHFMDGLGYAIPKYYLNADSVGEDYGNERRRFLGRIENLRIVTLHTRDFDGQQVYVPLKQGKVRIKRETTIGGDPTLKELFTDNYGYLVDNGSRLIAFQTEASNVTGTVRIYLEIELSNPDGSIAVFDSEVTNWWDPWDTPYSENDKDIIKETTDTDNLNYNSSLTPNYLNFGSSESGGRVYFLGEHKYGKVFTWANWSLEHTRNALAQNGYNLPWYRHIIHRSELSSSYDDDNKRMLIHTSQRSNERTTYHEFGHYIMSRLQNWTSLPDQQLYPNQIYPNFDIPDGEFRTDFNNWHPSEAFVEGFADGYAGIIDEMTRSMVDGESGYNEGVFQRNHPRVQFGSTNYHRLRHPYVSEWSFGAIMLDMWDGPNNLQQFTSDKATDPDWYGDFEQGIQHDFVELSFAKLLAPLYTPSTEGVTVVQDMLDYYQRLQSYQTCGQRQAIREVWHYNFSSVHNGLNAASFTKLGTDEIWRHESITTSVYQSRHGDPNITLGSTIYQYPGINVSTLNGPNESYHITGNNAGPDKVISDNLAITNGAVLYLHGNPTKRRWINDQPGLPYSTSTFRLSVEICGTAQVDVHSGSRMELGSTNGARGAHLTLNSGTKLTIHDGCQLLLNPNSEIQVKSGATLHLKPGALLTLQGVNNYINIERGGTIIIEGTPQIIMNQTANMINIKGNLDIRTNSTFTFTGSGFVRFELDPAIEHNLLVTPSSRIVFNGSGNTDKILEVAPNTHISPNDWTMAEILITNGLVELGNEAYINFASQSLTLQNCNFQGVNGRYRYLRVYGQNPLVQNCTFTAAQTALQGHLGVGAGLPLTLTNCTFSNYSVAGLHTIDKAVNMDYCSFTGTAKTGYGWRMDGAYLWENKIQNCAFTDNQYGIQLQSSTGGSLNLIGSSVNTNDIGVYFSSTGTFKGSCSNINGNNHGVKVYFGSLDLSNNSGLTIVNNGYGAPGSISATSVFLFEATNLSLYNGKNTIFSLDNARAGISGTFRAGTSIPVAGSGQQLNCYRNKWHATGGTPANNPRGAYNFDVDLRKFSAPFDVSPQTIYLVEVADASPLTGTQVNNCTIENQVWMTPTLQVDADQYIYALMKCASCETISTNSFSSDSLHKAVLFAASFASKYNPSGNDLLAVNLLKEILDFEMLQSTEESEMIREVAFQLLEEIYPRAVENSVNTTTAKQIMLDAILEQIESTGDTLVSNPDFYRFMSAALSAYSAGSLTEAREYLEEARPLSSFINEDYLGYWDCLLGLKEQLQDSLITENQLFELVIACDNNSVARGANKPDLMQYLRSMNVPENPSAVTQASKLELFPNPANEKLTISFTSKKSETAKVNIYDLSGRLVMPTIEVPALDGTNSYQISLGGLSEGVYTVHLNTSKGIEVGKLVVMR